MSGNLPEVTSKTDGAAGEGAQDLIPTVSLRRTHGSFFKGMLIWLIMRWG